MMTGQCEIGVQVFEKFTSPDVGTGWGGGDLHSNQLSFSKPGDTPPFFSHTFISFLQIKYRHVICYDDDNNDYIYANICKFQHA